MTFHLTVPAATLSGQNLASHETKLLSVSKPADLHVRDTYLATQAGSSGCYDLYRLGNRVYAVLSTKPDYSRMRTDFG